MRRAPAQCIVEGCDGTHKALGYCNKHYLRWQRTGDPLGKLRRGSIVYPPLRTRKNLPSSLLRTIELPTVSFPASGGVLEFVPQKQLLQRISEGWRLVPGYEPSAASWAQLMWHPDGQSIIKEREMENEVG